MVRDELGRAEEREQRSVVLADLQPEESAGLQGGAYIAIDIPMASGGFD